MNDAPGPPADPSEPDDESRQILEQLAEGVVLVDHDRTVRWLNPAARQMVTAMRVNLGTHRPKEKDFVS